MKKLIIFCITLLAIKYSNAQQTVESKEISFKISYIYTTNDTILALIKAGSNDGLKLNATGRVRSVYRKDAGTEGYAELGFFRIIYLRKDTCGAIITLNKKYSSKDSVREGDLITAYINIPKKDYHSLYFDLATMNIQFKDLNNKNFTTPAYIYQHDSKHLEDSLNKLIIADIKDVYFSLKDLFKPTDEVNKIIDSGRYKGKSVMEVMRDVKETDLKHFLQFVKSYPGKYIGYTWKSSETFATWVLNKGLTSAYEIKDELYSLRNNKTAFTKYALEHKASIKKEGTITTLGDESIDLIAADEFAKAKDILDFGFEIANAINDTSGKAILAICKAEWYQNQEKYTEAIPLCDESIKLATLCKNYNIEIQAHFKKIYCFYKISKYNEGRKAIAIVEKRLEELKPLIDASTYNFNLRKRYDYAGWIDYDAGNYKDALTNFIKAIQISKSINTFQSKNDLAVSYEYIGLTYNNQGLYKEALPYFDSSVAIYKNFGKKKLEAIITNRIGYSNFKLGNYNKSIDIYTKTFTTLIQENDYNNASYSKSMLGQSLWNLGKYNEAIASHKEAIQYGKVANNNSRIAFSWEKLGDLFKLTGEKTKALDAYDSSANYYAVIKDSSSIINNFNNVGDVYKNDKNYTKAVEYYNKAYGYAKSLNSKKQLINSLSNIAGAYFSYDSSAAKKYYKQCLELSKSEGDIVNQFYCLLNLGTLESRNYHFAASSNYLNQAVAISNKISSKEDIGFLYNSMGNIAYWQLDFTKAEQHYDKAMQIYDSIGNKTEYIKNINNIANLYISKGNFDVAEKKYKQSIAIAESISNKLLKADALNALSYLYQLQGEINKGFATNDSAMQLYTTTGSNSSLADGYITKGILYSTQGEYAKSVAAYTTADSIYTLEKMEFARATSINNIGNVYYLQADYEKALAAFIEAEKKLTPGIIDETYLLINVNIAECKFYLKQYKEAEKQLLELLPLIQSKQLNRLACATTLVLGKLYYTINQYNNAEKYLTSTKEIGVKNNETERIVESSIYLGKTYSALTKNEQAYNNLITAANISTQFNITKLNWEALYELGLYHYNNNKPDSAITYFKKAVELVEKNTNNLYGGESAKKKYSQDEKKVNLYSKLVAALAANNKTEEAWFYANKSSNAALKDKIGTITVNSNDKEKQNAVNKASALLQQQNAIEKSITDLQSKNNTQQNAQQIQQSAEQIASLNKKREIVASEYLNYIQKLIETYPDLSEYFKKNANPEEFKKYKSKLPADAAALLYLINDNQLLIFSVTNEKIGIKVIDMKEDINTTITQYIGLLNVPGKSSGTGTLQLRSTVLRERKPVTGVTFTETSEKLYNLLIKDVLPDIKDKKKLCIIPNGRLTNIPFQCLGQRMPDSSFHFLVEDYSIFYTSKLDIFLDNSNSEKNFASFTAFGNPDKSLPSAKTEVTEIGKIITKATVYTEEAATEEKAKNSLAKNKYVHFATHGILDYTDFKNSYLKFASDNNDDGKLTIEEVKTLDIDNCELVTLSACETAISQELKKGWYVSPANSFLINNVKSVVASLWSVDDNATSILMKEFYKNLQTMGKADALRKAQETLSKDPKYVHPFYWGAFVLYGDWK